MPDFSCLDCRVSTLAIQEYYTLDDDLWLSIVPRREGMLCVGCAEKRLGRFLTRADFKLNALLDVPRSARLNVRLTTLEKRPVGEQLGLFGDNPT